MQVTNESIFISALRSLCKSIAVILGVFLALIPILVFVSMFGGDQDLTRKTNFHILPDAQGEIKLLSERSPVVLQINIQGIIGTDHLTEEVVNNQLVDSRSGMLKKSRVKAILLNIDSPGGKVGDSDAIYRHILAYKKKYNVPVFAYVNEVCASGGMYIACAADQIYSSPVGVIGSIGVLLGPFFNFTDAFSKWGIGTKTLTEGKDKDTMNPFREWKENEDAPLKDILTFLYARFISVVTLARPQISKDLLENTYGAKVFDPITAKKIGLIDKANTSYNQTLADLAKSANIDQPYQVIELIPKKKWLSILSQSHLKSTIKHTIESCLPFTYQNQTSPFSYLYKPQK